MSGLDVLAGNVSNNDEHQGRSVVQEAARRDRGRLLARPASKLPHLLHVLHVLHVMVRPHSTIQLYIFAALSPRYMSLEIAVSPTSTAEVSSSTPALLLEAFLSLPITASTAISWPLR